MDIKKEAYLFFDIINFRKRRTYAKKSIRHYKIYVLTKILPCKKQIMVAQWF